MSANLKPFIARLAAGETLTDDQAEAAFDIIMSGEATPAQIGALADGNAHSRRDGVRNHRRGAGDARQDDGDRGAGRAPSMSAAPAATAPAP